jgi:glycosyltransferase involved in cell wall biosynthesis
MNSSLPDLRILLISSNSSSRGGGEKYLVYLADGLRRAGCSVEVLLSTVPYMDVWVSQLEGVGAVVHRRKLTALVQRPLRFIQSTRDQMQIAFLARFCVELSPDAIVVNQQYDEDGLDYVAGALASGCNRVCGVMHLPMTARKHERFLGKLRGVLLKNWYANHPYRLIFVSRGAQMEFERFYPQPRPTYVVNNAVKSMQRAERPVLRDWSNGIPVVGFLGQFVDQKNIMFLIEGWLAALKAGTQSKLLLIGDGPQRPEIERFLWRYAAPDSWHITGWTEKPDVYIDSVDLLVMASHFEGLSLGLIEFASRGIPAMIANFNGAAEIVERAPWVSLTTNSDLRVFTQDLTRTLQSLRTRQPVASNQLGPFADYFSLDRLAKQMLDVLELNAIH